MRNIVKFLFAALLIGIGFSSVWAANGIIETQLFSICPGDELELNIGEQKRVFTRDTIVYDTIAVTSPTQDSIYVYVINTYPNFIQRSTLSLEIGSSFEWHGQTIDKPGSYQDIHKNVYGCDSAYYLTVTERLPETVFYTVLDTTICEGNFIIWNGVKYTSSDVVYKVKHGAAGDRDSVYILHLTVQPISRQTESVAFTNWPAHYRDSVLEKPRAYEFRYIAKSGCDSIITVIANQQVITLEEQATICAGETFPWQGGTYGEAGQYQKVVRTKDGLHDSIYYRLTLNVLPIKRTYITKTICRGGSITFDGKVLTDKDAGVHKQTIKTAGCDSIVQLTLVVAEADTVYQVHQLLDGETYTWNGKDYSEAGVYFYSTTNVSGCDSTVQLTLTTKHVARKDTTVYICEGNSYTWHGITGSETYDYSKIVEEAGEMTVYTLHLIVNKIPHTWEEIQVDQFPYTYRGYEFTEPDSHDFKYLTSKGCDSIITVVANKRVIVDEQKVTICPGTTYKWGYDSYQEYGETGIYQVTEKTKDGTRDSIYHVLNLTVRYIPTTYENATICQGESYSFGGVTLFTPGMYTHKFKVDGCDSTVVLSLNVRANDTILRVHKVQEDALPLTWEGHYWTSPGVVDEVATNRFGCDSVTRFILTTHHVDTIDTVATICQGETLVWHGITGRETHKYSNIETLPNGDQVIYRLDLTVKSVEEVEQVLTMCQGTSVSFNGKTYTQAGTYYDRYNCDTIFKVIVKVNPVQVYVTNATLVGSSYTWEYGGKTKVLTSAGTYTETIENKETGCIDTYRIILKKDDTPYYFEESVTVCEGEDYVWHGKEGLSLQGIGTTTDYTDEYQTVGGKDSIYTLHLTVLPIKHSSRTISFCTQFEWKGKTYTESAVVYDTVASSVGCDSIIRVYLDKSPTYLFHDTVTIVQGEILNWYGWQINQAGLYRQPFTTVNGCDSIYELGVGLVEATQQLPIYTTQRSICEGDVFIWDHNGKEYSVSGTYIDTVRAAKITDPDTVYILNLKVWPTPLDTIVQHLYACGGENMIRYNGVEYTQDTAIITNYRTIHNCDSIVKTFLHFNTALFQSDTLHLADNDTTRFWHEYKINHAGTYYYEEKAEGECYNREELVVFMHTTYRYVKDTAICQTEIPYRWWDGPQEPSKLAIEYAHEPGITKTYEHKYKTQEGYDSIYVLNLTIYPTYELRQQIHLCENESRSYNGKNYYGWEMKADSLYRDTIRMSSKDNCDSILFMEIIMHPVKRFTETKVLPQDSVLIWNGITITKNGTYTVEPTPTQTGNGCDSIVELRAIFEDVSRVGICALDTPYTWRETDYYTSGLWKDTVFDLNNGQISEVYVLDLTVTRPIEKTLSLRGCLPEGVTFNDKIYLRDTIVNDTLHTCDTIYSLHINVDTAYIINIVDTICEHELPYILGRIDPDTIWQEGFFTHEEDTTMLGCDSTINLTLRIIPSLDRNDSTFVCEDFFANGGAVYLGDTIHPWFDHNYHGKWEGKWHGVMYTEDTIVYNCDSSHFHHIIKRPSQKIVKDTIVYICPGDTIGFSAFRTTSFDDTTRFAKDTIYEEHVPMTSMWTDERHHISYNNDAYTCDSITRWHIKVRDVRAKDTTAHKLLGDSIMWNGVWRYHTGDYDSIAYATDTNILGDHCPYIYTLHLIMDTAYYFRDTIYSLCTPANKTHTHIWDETNYKQKFTVGNIDTIGRHYIDSMKTHDSRDSIYDLFVIYSIIRDTLIYDTICAGEKYQFHQNRGTVERWLDTTGRYSDTIQRTNPAGCDSIITLQLYVRPSVVTKPKQVSITDRELPYKWKHEWKENGLPTDSTDTLLASGLYTFRMPNRFGCDSIDSLYLNVHYTHVFRDTVDTCAPINTTLKYTWATNYVQTFTTPKKDSLIHYYDTLNTRIKLDSIYDLYVHFHQTYEKHIYDTICEGDSSFIPVVNGSPVPRRYFKHTGIFHDTVPTEFGCDSVITLHLQVWPKSPKTHRIVHLADTLSPYVWEHIIIRGADKDTLRDTLQFTGEYSRRLENIYGCDSIDSLSLFFHETYKIQESPINICKTETPLMWYNQVITTTGDYVYNGRTKEGYDSIYYVHVNVTPTTYDTIRKSICEGDSLRFGLTLSNQERYVSLPGRYNDTVVSHAGCDSIITLFLSVYPKQIAHKTVHIADIDTPYVWEHVIIRGAVKDTLRDTLFAAGGYSRRLETVFGCDSIDSLSLFIHKTYSFTDRITICERETPYTWKDRNDITTSGTYIYNPRTKDGYDSIYTVTITVVPTLYDTLRRSICSDKLPFEFHGTPLYKGGLYSDTLTSSLGCDSIQTLILTVNEPYYHFERHDIYADQSFDFFGETLSESGTYKHSSTTPAGCDSITEIQLVVHPVIDTIVTICANDLPYHWTNKWKPEKVTLLHSPGIYHDDTTYVNGQRTFWSVKLNVLEQVFDTIRQSICDGSGYSFNGKNYTKAGIYRDTLVATNGCDRIITTILTLFPKSGSHQTVHIADVDTPYVWEHIQWCCGVGHITVDSLYAPGEYRYRMENQYGCDSIDSLSLKIHKTYLYRDTVTICQSETPYEWEGIKDIYTTSTHTKNYLTHDGYDSILIRHIIVHPVKRSTIYKSICEGDSLRFGLTKLNRERFVKEAKTYYDTLITTDGCDSIITLVLSVNPKQFAHKTVHIKDVEKPYIWEHVIIRGTIKDTLRDTLISSGEYSRRLETVFGCDSIDSLSLRIHNTYSFTEKITICESETPYTWKDRNDITASGTYVYNPRTKDGYDSIFTATITVVPTLYDTIRRAVCRDKLPFVFLGDSWNEGGQKSYTLPSSLGCDSIVTLILTVSEPYYHFERVDIYQGTSYNFFGDELTTSGTYKHTNSTPSGCDSISELQLVVHPVIDTVVTICANDLPYRWINKWKPEKVTLLHSPGVYHDDTTYVNGIRTFWSIDLRVNEPKFNTIGRTICQGSSFTFNNQNLSKSGTYRDTLTAANGCDSIVTLILQVSKPKEDTIYQTICAGSSYHFHKQDLLEQGEYRDTLTSQTGCDSIVVLKLRVLPTYYNVITRSIYAGDTVHFHGETYSDPGRYQFRHTSAFGCDSIVELNLIVNKLFDDSVAVCQNELPYRWHSKEIWKDGIYRDTTLDGNNLPVISGIKVRVLPVVRKADPIVVTICEGENYPFKGQFLTKQGTYYDTLTSKQFGCDSIITLNLQVIPQSFKSESKSIFEGDSIRFYDAWLKTAGTYVHQEDNGNHCFNTHELILTVLSAAHRDTTAIICEHELPYIWYNVPYYKSGDYEQRTVWNDSAHVVTTLHLVVNQGFYGERNVSLCEGGTYIHKGNLYTKNGYFYDTIPAQTGCDSIIKYIISVHPTYDRIDTVHIADKDSCKFHGRALRLSGTYEWDSVSIHGCDSMEHIVLIVHPSFYHFDSIDLCQGDTLTWRERRIYKSGLYSDSLHTKYGFDSVYQVRVNVHQKYFIEQQYHITEGNPTYIHGINISQPGVYYDSLYTIHGCDSVYRVVVNWARTFTQHWDVTICQGDTFPFFKRMLTHSGEYTYNSVNKDSTIYLKLTVSPSSITEKRIVITPDDLPYIYNGRTYENAGVYADTFVNHYKCDSIVRLNLVVTSHYSEWEQIPLCPGQTLKIEGEIITKPGTYTFTKRSTTHGPLDSLYRVEVFEAPDYESPFDTLIVCEGDTVMFAGKQLVRGGTYTANLKTIHGCDSILHLFLTINPSYSFPTKATITDYQSFTWRGKEYNTQGIFTQSYPTVFDCDSTYLLDLTVLPTQRIVVNDSICFRDTLRWRDHILTEPGIYSDTICNLASHTSIIYTLNLGVVTPTIITTASVTETPADVESFKIRFSYSGLRPTAYNIIFDELAHSQGFKDIVNKPFGADIVAEVPMPKKEKVVYQEHTAYVKPDYYTMRLALDNGVCGISRSDSLSLLIKYPSWIIEQNWDNVVAPLQPAYNGGYEFGAYKWFVNESEFDNGGLPYIYSNSLKPGDRVVLHATRIGESYAIPTAPLVITKAVPDVFPNPVLVYPNATTKAKHSVTLKAEQNGTYFVYSTTGQLFSTGTFESGEQLIDLPATSGCCLIRATTVDGFILTEKIVVY